MSEDRQTRRRPRPPQLLALAVGLVYLALAVAGFVDTGVDRFVRDPENVVWVFGVSTLLNLVYAFTALIALYSARTLDSTQNFGWLATIAFIALSAYGIVAAIGGDAGEPLNVNWANNWLHLGTALVAALIGWSARRAAGARMRT